MQRAALPGVAATIAVLLALPAHAQEGQDLRKHDGSPIAGLVRADLDGATQERQICLGMAARLDRLATLLDDATRGVRTAEFGQIHADADRLWFGDRGQCDQAIGSLERGWPRSVIVTERNLADRLWAALLDAASAFAGGATVSEFNARIEAYDALLAEWVAWLVVSSRFWAGEFLEDRLRTCLVDAWDRAAALRAALWDLMRVPASARSRADTEAVELRIGTARQDLEVCKPASDLEAVERQGLDLTLQDYGAAAAALGQGDDRRAHDAMAREQDHVSRLARCRNEWAEERPSADCQPQSQP